MIWFSKARVLGFVLCSLPTYRIEFRLHLLQRHLSLVKFLRNAGSFIGDSLLLGVVSLEGLFQIGLCALHFIQRSCLLVGLAAQFGDDFIALGNLCS